MIQNPGLAQRNDQANQIMLAAQNSGPCTVDA
jgi:hypothetical protein